MAVATVIVKGHVVTRKCAEATAIPKGTTMKLTTDNTVIASSADNDPFGGITIEEFTGGEDKYSVACDMSGVYDIDTTAAAITAPIIELLVVTDVFIKYILLSFVASKHLKWDNQEPYQPDFKLLDGSHKLKGLFSTMMQNPKCYLQNVTVDKSSLVITLKASKGGNE